jgi:hypothetical protein
MCETPRSASGAIRPRWTLLYSVALGGMVAQALAEIATPSGGLRTGVRCALALGAFLAIASWVRGNRAALDLQRWCDCAPGTITVRVIQSSQRTARVAPELPHPTPASIEKEHEFAHP